MTRSVALTDFLTDDEITLAIYMWEHRSEDTGYAKAVCDTIIRPNLERINHALGQENDPMYLAYAIEFIMERASTAEKRKPQ